MKKKLSEALRDCHNDDNKAVCGDLFMNNVILTLQSFCVKFFMINIELIFLYNLQIKVQYHAKTFVGHFFFVCFEFLI